MKRSMVLTAVFALLFGAIAISGCQTSNTASTRGGGGGSSSDCAACNGDGVIDIGGCIGQCTDDCTQQCTASCNESCSHCQIGEGTYDCTDPAGCLTCWFDCNLALCTEICSGMLKADCSTGGGSNNNGGSSSDSNSSDPSITEVPNMGCMSAARDLIEGVDYTIINLSAEDSEGSMATLQFEIVFLKDFSDVEFVFTTYAQPNGKIFDVYRVHNSNIKTSEKLTPTGASHTASNYENADASYTIEITSARGIDG
ncbi:MAG: hypothetical protein E7349_07235 [Clostridiales bacterium]|nr:hypothetical protein [Clostridiales bacterium]